jgi:hypothetical protein
MMTERSLTRSEARADALEQIKRGQFIVAESQELLRRIDEMIAKEGLAPFKFALSPGSLTSPHDPTRIDDDHCPE